MCKEHKYMEDKMLGKEKLFEIFEKYVCTHIAYIKCVHMQNKKTELQARSPNKWLICILHDLHRSQSKSSYEVFPS